VCTLGDTFPIDDPDLGTGIGRVEGAASASTPAASVSCYSASPSGVERTAA